VSALDPLLVAVWDRWRDTRRWYQNAREFINCRLQAALPSRSAEKIELNPIFDFDKVESDHANQAEGTRLVELIEKIDTHWIEPLRRVGRLTEPALTAQDLKVGGLELYAHAQGQVALLSETPADRVGWSAKVESYLRLRAYIPLERAFWPNALRGSPSDDLPGIFCLGQRMEV
jgi:hypothetical protein